MQTNNMKEDSKYSTTYQPKNFLSGWWVGREEGGGWSHEETAALLPLATKPMALRGDNFDSWPQLTSTNKYTVDYFGMDIKYPCQFTP